MTRERGGKRVTSDEVSRRRALAELRELVASGAVDRERVNRYLADQAAAAGEAEQAEGPAAAEDLASSEVATKCEKAGGATGRAGRRLRLLGHPTRSGQARKGRG